MTDPKLGDTIDRAFSMLGEPADNYAIVEYGNAFATSDISTKPSAIDAKRRLLVLEN